MVDGDEGPGSGEESLELEGGWSPKVPSSKCHTMACPPPHFLGGPLLPLPHSLTPWSFFPNPGPLFSPYPRSYPEGGGLYHNVYTTRLANVEYDTIITTLGTKWVLRHSLELLIYKFFWEKKCKISSKYLMLTFGAPHLHPYMTPPGNILLNKIPQAIFY